MQSEIDGFEKNNDDKILENENLLAKLSRTYQNSMVIESSINSPKQPNEREVFIMSIGYMLAMGVCGFVLVALGSTLSELAYNIGLTATDIGTVFIARGLGAVAGAASSSKLFVWFQGNNIMALSLFIILILLCVTPFNDSYIGIHVIFFFMGLNTSITGRYCLVIVITSINILMS